MTDFESYRATLHTFENLRGHLSCWQLDENAIMEQARQNTISAVRKCFSQEVDLPARFAQPQQELYLTVHQDCGLYVGNTGAETRCLGDLRTLDPGEVAEVIRVLPGNRDYGAFYDVHALPDEEKIVDALGRLPQNLVYGDMESILYRALTELDTPTILLTP